MEEVGQLVDFDDMTVLGDVTDQMFGRHWTRWVPRY